MQAVGSRSNGPEQIGRGNSNAGWPTTTPVGAPLTESGGTSGLWPTVYEETKRDHWKIEEKVANSASWLTGVRSDGGRRSAQRNGQ